MFKIIFGLFFLAYFSLMPTLHSLLATRPLAVKSGYLPSGELLKIVTGEFRTLFSDWAVIRTLFYFGSIFELNQRNITTTPEYAQMYHNLVQALKLDPYNQDIYYFSQATFTWDVGRVNETNNLLEYGLKYRTWDWQLPFWLGFNNAYFLKNYDLAADHFKKAAELSGNSLFTRLAARFYSESGRDELGIAFLDTMIESARNDQVRQLYKIRRDALVAVQLLRTAMDNYQSIHGQKPEKLDKLTEAGLIDHIPVDPYGGNFYLDDLGQVRTTSKFAFNSANKQESFSPTNNNFHNSQTESVK